MAMGGMFSFFKAGTSCDFVIDDATGQTLGFDCSDPPESDASPLWRFASGICVLGYFSAIYCWLLLIVCINGRPLPIFLYFGSGVMASLSSLLLVVLADSSTLQLSSGGWWAISSTALWTLAAIITWCYEQISPQNPPTPTPLDTVGDLEYPESAPVLDTPNAPLAAEEEKAPNLPVKNGVDDPDITVSEKIAYSHEKIEMDEPEIKIHADSEYSNSQSQNGNGNDDPDIPVSSNP